MRRLLSAGVLIAVLIMILIAVLIMILVVVLICVAVLVLILCSVIHRKIPPNSLLRGSRCFSIPRTSGFILCLKQNSGN